MESEGFEVWRDLLDSEGRGGTCGTPSDSGSFGVGFSSSLASGGFAGVRLSSTLFVVGCSLFAMLTVGDVGRLCVNPLL